jgi:hypothetical protein
VPPPEKAAYNTHVPGRWGQIRHWQPGHPARKDYVCFFTLLNFIRLIDLIIDKYNTLSDINW